MRLFAITEAISYHIESMSPVAFEKTDIAKFLQCLSFFFLHIFASFFVVSWFFLVYKNCSEAPRKTGIYHILDKQSQTFAVFCDQVTEGGGKENVYEMLLSIKTLERGSKILKFCIMKQVDEGVMSASLYLLGETFDPV